MSLVVDVANAVVSKLNAAPAFSQSFTAARKYLPLVDLQDGSPLTVLVAAKSLGVEYHARSSDGFRITVDIGILKNVTAIDDDQSQLDALVGLVEEIVDRLRFENLMVGAESVRPALFQEIVNEPIYARDHLREKRQFTSLVTVTYLLLRK